MNTKDLFALNSFISKPFSTTMELSNILNRSIAGLAPLFLRILLAYEFGEAGLEKLNGENWFADLAFPFPFNLLPPSFSWWLATFFELSAPIAFIAGFATRFFSVCLMVLTVVAIAAVHWPMEWHSLAELWQGYVIIDHGFGNFKLPLMYLFMLASLFCSGSGPWSVDAWLASKFRFNQAVNEA